MPLTAPRDASVTIRRGEGVSAWRQIADAIRGDLASGAVAPGSRLPTEAELAKRFGVNRHTVRRALAGLAADGLVRTTQGSGTFAEAPPLAYPLSARTRFSEIVAQGGRDPGGLVLGASTEPADDATATALGVAPGDPVLEIATLRSADGVPLSFARSRLVLPRFAGAEAILARGATWSETLAALGAADYVRAETRIAARAAVAEEAARLEMAAGRTVLVLDSVNRDARGVPIQATTSVFSADRVTIVVDR